MEEEVKKIDDLIASLNDADVADNTIGEIQNKYSTAAEYALEVEKEAERRKEELNSNSNIDDDERLKEQEELQKTSQLIGNFKKVEQKEKSRLVKIPSIFVERFKKMSDKIFARNIDEKLDKLEDRLVEILKSDTNIFAKKAKLKSELNNLGYKIDPNDKDALDRFSGLEDAVQLFNDTDKYRISYVEGKLNSLESTPIKTELMYRLNMKKNQLYSTVNNEVSTSSLENEALKVNIDSAAFQSPPFNFNRLFDKIIMQMGEVANLIKDDLDNIELTLFKYEELKYLYNELETRPFNKMNFKKSTLERIKSNIAEIGKDLYKRQNKEEKAEMVVGNEETQSAVIDKDNEKEKLIEKIDLLLKEIKETKNSLDRQSRTNELKAIIDKCIEAGYITDKDVVKKYRKLLKEALVKSKVEEINEIKEKIDKTTTSLKSYITNYGSATNNEKKDNLEQLFVAIIANARKENLLTEEEIKDWEEKFNAVKQRSNEQPVDEDVDENSIINPINVTPLKDNDQMNFAYSELIKKCDSINKMLNRVINGGKQINSLRTDFEELKDSHFQELYNQLSDDEKIQVDSKISYLNDSLSLKEKLVFGKNDYEEDKSYVESLRTNAKILDDENKISDMKNQLKILIDIMSKYSKNKAEDGTEPYSLRQADEMVKTCSQDIKKLREMISTINLDDQISEAIEKEFKIILNNINSGESLDIIEMQYANIKENLKKYNTEISSEYKSKFALYSDKVDNGIKRLKLIEANREQIFNEKKQHLKQIEEKINSISSKTEYDNCSRMVNDQFDLLDGANTNILSEENKEELKKQIKKLAGTLNIIESKYVEKVPEVIENNIFLNIQNEYKKLIYDVKITNIEQEEYEERLKVLDQYSKDNLTSHQQLAMAKVSHEARNVKYQAVEGDSIGKAR